MMLRGKSLRLLVDEWIGAGETLKLTRPPRSRSMPWRAVQVEIARPTETIAVIFFRHSRGSWCVYPPPRRTPSMRTF